MKKVRVVLGSLIVGVCLIATASARTIIFTLRQGTLNSPTVTIANYGISVVGPAVLVRDANPDL